MIKDEILEILEQYALQIKSKFSLRMVLLMKNYSSEQDAHFETIVVVDHLKQDFLEAQDLLLEVAAKLDPRIEPTLVEMDRIDPTGFFDEIKKKGIVAYWRL